MLLDEEKAKIHSPSRTTEEESNRLIKTIPV